MESPKTLGRITGVLLLAQALLAGPVYTAAGMMRPVIAPGFLTNAAGDAMQIRVAVLLTVVLGALTVAVALTTLPFFRRYSERMAHLFLGLSFVGLATQAIEGVAVRNMVSMSLQYAKTAGSRAVLEVLEPLARSTWSSAHFFNLASGHIKVLVLFAILYRFALVPRGLAAVGVAATLLSTTAVTLPLLGRPFSYPLIIPTALTMLTLCVWLIVKGFAPRESHVDVSSRDA